MPGRNRNAQIMGQIFVYVFASIIFVMVLIYGYQAIQKFTQQSDWVAMIELQTKMRSTVNSIGSSTDSIERARLPVPSTVRRICFVDLRKDPQDASQFTSGQIPGVCFSGHADYNPRICNSWTENVERNVFFIPSASLNIQVGDITIYNSYGVETGSTCFNISQDVIYVMLEGRGDSTGIKHWSPIG